MLNANQLSNTDSMKIYVTGNDERIMVHAIFDNLGKGASGAAVQCMNIALGFTRGYWFSIRLERNL